MIIIMLMILNMMMYRGTNGEDETTSPEGSPSGPQPICAQHQQVMMITKIMMMMMIMAPLPYVYNINRLLS